MSLSPNSRQEGLTDRACMFPRCFTDASASSKAVFNIRRRRSTDCNGSKGGLNTVGRSHVGTVTERGKVERPRPLQKTNKRIGHL